MSKTAGIYIRLSKEDRNKINKEDDSESITNQRRMLLDYCLQNGFDVYDIYNDEDFSGSDRERPEFNRMIDDARNKKFDVVLCKTQSRFARDVEIVEKYINGLFPIWGIQFIGVVDNTDSNNTRTLKQRQISALVDGWYLSDLSENVRATLSSKRKEGLWVGAFAPYGYVKDPENKNRLIVDEEAAEVVRYVFSLYLSGLGITSITKRLNDEHIPNPATYKQAHGQPFQSSHKDCSDLWHTYSISRMLSNEVYIGNVVQGMSENVSYKSTKKRKKKREEWDVVEGVHEPIINRDIWDCVQNLRAGKPKSLNRYDAVNVFAGKIKCAECGGSMRIFYNRHNRYYRCSTKFIADERCTGHYISEKVLHKVVLSEVRKLYADCVDEEEAAEQLDSINGIKKKIVNLGAELKKLDKEIDKLDKRLESIYIDKLDRVITPEEFTVLKKRFTADKERCLKKREYVSDELEQIKRQQSDSDSRLEIVKRFKDIQELDFETVHTLIDYIEIGGTRDNRIINIYWNI